MTAYSKDAKTACALSDADLEVVTGGERHQVTRDQYDTLNMVRMVVAGTYKASTNPNDLW